MRQKVTFMLLAMLFCCVLGIHAQTGGQVSGKVVDAMGELPGVSVVVKGTTNGTTTDLEGKFALGNVKPSDILQFSFIGYKTQDIKGHSISHWKKMPRHWMKWLLWDTRKSVRKT